MRKGEHNGRLTSRFFRDFAVIVDHQGNRTTVRESSSVGQRAVHLFCIDADGDKAKVGPPWRKVEGAPHLVIASPELSVRDARRLIAALQRFIDDVPVRARGGAAHA